MAVSYSIPPRLNCALGVATGLAGALLWRAPWRPEAALSAWVLWENAQFTDVDAAGLKRGTVSAVLLCISAASLFGAVAVAQAQRTTADESGAPQA